MKRLVLLFIFSSLFISVLPAQDLTGIWRGYFITDNYEQYRYEIQMEQKNNTLNGVTYSYLDKQFYGKCTMTGHFTKENNNTLIQEVKTIEVKITSGHVTCIQKCLLNYIKEGREEFLEGTFTSKLEKADTLMGYKKGADCGGGKMYLRKVITSDFYIEPFLRDKINKPKEILPETNTNPTAETKSKTGNTTPGTNKTATNNTTSTTRTTPNKTTTNKSTTNKTTTNSKTPATSQKNNITSNQNKTAITVKPKKDSVKTEEVTIVKPKVENNISMKPSAKLPEQLATRENNLVKTLVINSENVTVKLFDNGEIDGDTISVYLDNKLILSKQELTAKALTVNLKMDESNDVHELVMVAENLGRIPPNTSLMIVTAGDQRFEVRITSTEQKNAVVRFKYEKP